MKTIIALAFFSLSGWSANAQHDHGSMGHSSAPAHAKKEAAHSHRAVPEFQAQLHTVFTASLQLNEGLVASDASKVKASAGETKTALSKVDLALLNDEPLMDWMAYLKTLNESLDVITNTDDLVLQRKSFAAFSEALYKSLKEFGTGGLAVYYNYCPMANQNSGAYWLSHTKEIRNPFLGESMLSCGKLKETLQ